MGASIPIVKKDFLLLFDEYIINNDLYIGKIYTEKGELLENWLTFRGKRKIIVRGSIHGRLSNM